MLTIDEAAAELNLSRESVEKYIRQGRIKAVKKGVWDINRRSLRAFAAKERKPGRPKR